MRGLASRENKRLCTWKSKSHHSIKHYIAIPKVDVCIPVRIELWCFAESLFNHFVQILNRERRNLKRPKCVANPNQRRAAGYEHRHFGLPLVARFQKSIPRNARHKFLVLNGRLAEDAYEPTFNGRHGADLSLEFTTAE